MDFNNAGKKSELIFILHWQKNGRTVFFISPAVFIKLLYKLGREGEEVCFKESVCDTSGDELKILRSHQGEKSAKVPFFVNLCERVGRGGGQSREDDGWNPLPPPSTSPVAVYLSVVVVYVL